MLQTLSAIQNLKLCLVKKDDRVCQAKDQVVLKAKGHHLDNKGKDRQGSLGLDKWDLGLLDNLDLGNKEDLHLDTQEPEANLVRDKCHRQDRDNSKDHLVKEAHRQVIQDNLVHKELLKETTCLEVAILTH